MVRREEIRAMQDAWRAYLDLALGLTETSRKKATKVAKKLVGRGNATAEQLQSMAEDLVSTSLANREALTRLVHFELERALGKVGLATAEEVTALTTRVRELEEQLEEAKNGRASAAPTTGAPLTSADPAQADATGAAVVPAKAVPAKKAGPAKTAASTSNAAPAKTTAPVQTTAPAKVVKKAVAKKTATKKTVAKKAATPVVPEDDAVVAAAAGTPASAPESRPATVRKAPAKQTTTVRKAAAKRTPAKQPSAPTQG